MILRIVAVICAVLVIVVAVSSGFSRNHDIDASGEQGATPGQGEFVAVDRKVNANRHAAMAAAPVLPSGVYQPPAVADQRLTAFVDRQVKIEDRLFDDMSTAMPVVYGAQDVDAVRRVLKDVQELDVIRHEAANLLRRSQCESVADDLIVIMRNPGDGVRFRGWATQHLGSMLVEVPESKDRLTSALRASLRVDCIEVQREALLALCRVQDHVAARVADEWLGFQRGDERLWDAALRGLVEVDPMRALVHAQQLVSNPSERLRVAAYAVIGDVGGPAEVSLLEAAIRKSDESLRVRYAASNALGRIRSRPE